MSDFPSKIVTVQYEYIETLNGGSCHGCIFEADPPNNHSITCPASTTEGFICRGIINRMLSSKME